MKSERNITRMDYERTHGWWVRIYRGTGADKRVHARSFADGKYGGKRKALAAARAWRDRVVKKLGPALGNGSVTPLGHGYVRRIEVVQRGGAAYPHWVAWCRVGHRKWASTKRSIRLYGSAEARRQCEAWLRKTRAAARMSNAKPHDCRRGVGRSR